MGHSIKGTWPCERPAEPYMFEHLRNESWETREDAVNSLSDDDFRNLLMDFAARGILDARWLIPGDFAGQYDWDVPGKFDKGKRWWMIHTGRGMFKIDVCKIDRKTGLPEDTQNGTD